ncbi:FkbM family methyltransferase [Candidatus Pelagibacter sp.]|jgi:FkbM family methyltransferase|nr:FkbM family methyltransferase [Candidatus Pelagibacter sp.]|tara:strand:+ start:99 stop:755 length:657 start_codon:yes stop_codon:yes gene_type:complete
MKKILKTLKTHLKRFRKFNSISSLDKKMLKYLDYKNGYFIECGAYDGVNQSNTWYYEKELNWKGILIEPNFKKFQLLKKFRGEENIFINCALVNKDYDQKEIKIYENDLASATYDKNLFKNPYFNQYLELPFYYSNVNNLTNILIESKAPKLIDFFSLDVEGYEENIINGINFNEFNFRYFLIETSNPNINKILFKNNYDFIGKLSNTPDLLFKYNKV